MNRAEWNTPIRRYVRGRSSAVFLDLVKARFHLREASDSFVRCRALTGKRIASANAPSANAYTNGVAGCG